MGTGPVVIHRGKYPPCMRPEGKICRGCSGWRYLIEAASPGGPWEGHSIYCFLSGLTYKAGRPEIGGGG